MSISEFFKVSEKTWQTFWALVIGSYKGLYLHPLPPHTLWGLGKNITTWTNLAFEGNVTDAVTLSRI